MPYRVSYQWNQAAQKSGGWTENWWNNAGTLAIASTRAGNLGALNDPIHGAQAWNPRIRISNPIGIRDSTTLYYPAAAPGVPTSSTPDADYPTTSLQLAIKSQLGYLVTAWLRGLPDALVTNAGRFTPSNLPTWTPAWNAYVAVLVNPTNQWSVRVLDRTVLRTPVRSISIAGVVNAPGHGFAVGTFHKVRISRSLAFAGVNGIWTVQGIDANNVQLQNFTPPAAVAANQGNAKMWEIAIIYDQIVQVTVVGATKHNVGRPLGLLSGRRRKRKT